MQAAAAALPAAEAAAVMPGPAAAAAAPGAAATAVTPGLAATAAVSPGAAATAVTPGTAAAAAAQGATPPALALRDWRRVAQRTVRLALTATRTAWSGFHDASEQGHAALAGLADTLILLVSRLGQSHTGGFAKDRFAVGLAAAGLFEVAAERWQIQPWQLWQDPGQA